jgi:hypothetical protein
MSALLAYTPTSFFKQMTAQPKTFQDLIPTIQAHAAAHRTATTSRERARHLADLYNYLADYMLLVWTQPKHLADFAAKACEVLPSIPAAAAVPEYVACRDALEMFIVLAGNVA